MWCQKNPLLPYFCFSLQFYWKNNPEKHKNIQPCKAIFGYYCNSINIFLEKRRVSPIKHTRLSVLFSDGKLAFCPSCVILQKGHCAQTEHCSQKENCGKNITVPPPKENSMRLRCKMSYCYFPIRLYRYKHTLCTR